eukprot:981638-Rhodomonas_salina.2
MRERESVAKGVAYLEKRGYTKVVPLPPPPQPIIPGVACAVEWLNGPAKKAEKDPQKEYLGTVGSKVGANRAVFGET